MYYVAMIECCKTCAGSKNKKTKLSMIERIASNALDRLQFSAAEGVDCANEEMSKVANKCAEAVDLFEELEESCYICMTHGGDMAIVAHDLAQILYERINQRKEIKKEADTLIKDEKPKHLKVVPLEPGPYKKN